MEETGLEDIFGDLMKIEDAVCQREEAGAAGDDDGVPEAADANESVSGAVRGCSRRGFIEFWDCHIVMPPFLLEQQQQQQGNAKASTHQDTKDRKTYRSYCWFPGMGPKADPPSSSPSKSQGSVVDVVVVAAQGGKPKAAAPNAFYEWQTFTL